MDKDTIVVAYENRGFESSECPQTETTGRVDNPPDLSVFQFTTRRSNPGVKFLALVEIWFRRRTRRVRPLFGFDNGFDCEERYVLHERRKSRKKNLNHVAGKLFRDGDYHGIMESPV